MLCSRGVARTNVQSMNEFITVSSSSYDPASLATKLTEKAAEGWHVVAIVPTGGDVTAFLSRETEPAGAITEADPVEAPAQQHTEEAIDEPTASGAAAEPANADLVSMTPAAIVEPAPASETAPVSEPAGWASAPEETAAETAAAPAEVAAAPAAAYEPQPTPAAVAPAVPAGWYGDPAGRFELRYWDGGAWTEHVSRAGQQFTDPPVA